ncbi:hypothetical protein [Clostridium massiliamazoniense]|uniref:hypothetical protein n=1 Tax=Clostridium massiliamazoniense TaxID=1347366 RepID=UPI0006D7736C|nr:hypothetical protein [Clostridium massiliamazoniense]
MNRKLQNRCNKNIVLKSKVSLIRNLDDKIYSSFLDNMDAIEIAREIKNKILNLEKYKFKVFKIREESRETSGQFLERGLINEHLFNNKESGEFLYDDLSGVAVMLNEGNHITIVKTTIGLSLSENYKMVKDLDDYLDDEFEFAFDEKLGYLTMDKNDLGTAMKIYLVLHIPILSYKGEVEDLKLNLKNIDVGLSSVFGEGNGAFYEISNIKSLGDTEEEIIGCLEAVANEIILKEKRFRDELMNNDAFINAVEDEVFRAYGVLTNARIITFEEAIDLLSKLRLGIEFYLIDSIKLATVDKLIEDIQYYNLKVMSKNNKNEEEEKILRAKIIRERLIG